MGARHHSISTGPTGKHTTDRHLRISLTSQRGVRHQVAERVAPGEHRQTQNHRRDVQHQTQRVEQTHQLVGDGRDPDDGQHEAHQDQDREVPALGRLLEASEEDVAEQQQDGDDQKECPQRERGEDGSTEIHCGRVEETKRLLEVK